MNFQSKVIETTTNLRAQIYALADTAMDATRARAAETAQRAGSLKGTFATLRLAGGQLGKVARRHVSRLVEQNSSLVVDAGKDFSALARATYAQLARRDTVTARKPRKTTSRKRKAKSA
jgi:hypothetical protein